MPRRRVRVAHHTKIPACPRSRALVHGGGQCGRGQLPLGVREEPSFIRHLSRQTLPLPNVRAQSLTSTKHQTSTNGCEGKDITGDLFVLCALAQPQPPPPPPPSVSVRVSAPAKSRSSSSTGNPCTCKACLDSGKGVGGTRESQRLYRYSVRPEFNREVPHCAAACAPTFRLLVTSSRAREWS